MAFIVDRFLVQNLTTVHCNVARFDNIAAVLFDKDGTLADSHPFLQKLGVRRAQRIEQQVPGVASQLMATFGCDSERYDPAGLMAVGTRYQNEIAAAAYIASMGRPWGEALRLAKVAFLESDRSFTRKADHTPPFTGVVQLLKRLHASGLKLAVLSGDTTSNVRDFVIRYGLNDLVGWCAGSEQAPMKPDPLMLQKACQQLSVLPEQSLVVGDSMLDFQLASTGKARAFVSVTWGGSPGIAEADVIVEHPEDIQEFPD